MRKIKLLLAFSGMALSVSGAHAATLRSAVSFTEIRSGKEPRLLPDDQEPLAIDINSKVSISFAPGNLDGMLMDDRAVDPGRAQHAAQLKALLVGMEKWTGALVSAWEGAARLAKTPKTDPKYREISRATNNGFQGFVTGLSQYESALMGLPGGAERAQSLRSKLNEAMGLPIIERHARILSLFRAEVESVNAEIRQLSSEVRAAGAPLGVKMTAIFIHGGQETPLHLSGYDSEQADFPQPYEKIRMEPTEQDKKILKEIGTESAGLAAKLREAKSGQDALRVIGGQFAETHFGEVRKAVEELSGALTSLNTPNWDAKLSKLSSLQAETFGLAEAEFHSFISSASEVVMLRESISRELSAANADLAGIRRGLSDANGLRSQGKPDEFLIALLSVGGQAERTAATISGALAKTDMERLAALQKALISRVDSVRRDAQQRARDAVSELFEPEASQIKSVVGKLATAVGAMKNARAELGEPLIGQLIAAGGGDLPDVDSAYVVPLGEARDTSFNVMEARGREEGDAIVYRLTLYRMKKADGAGALVQDGMPLEEVKVQFELKRYGMYSRPGGGVVFVSRVRNPVGASPVRGQPAPSVTWVVQGRTWPKSGQQDSSDFWETLRLAVGFHATTLNFGGSGAEMGVGPTISLFNDLLQGGYGRNLHVANSSDYWYLGFRLIHFGKGSGIK